MKKSLPALLLALVMVISLFAGCGNSSAASSAAATSSAAASSAAAEPAAAEAATETSEQTAEAASAAEADGTYTQLSEYIEEEPLEGEISTRTDPEYAELYEAWHEAAADSLAQMPGIESTYDADGTEISVKGVRYEYPLEGDDLELSIWAVITGNHNGVINDYSDYRSYARAQEATGVTINWTSVSGMVATEQMGLMLASGDLTDLIAGTLMCGYSSTDLYDQDLIVDLTDIQSEYCPNYEAWVASDEKYQKLFKDDEGHSFGWYDMYNAMTPEGWFIRTDKLDEWGIDAPQTIAEYEDCFARMVDEGSRATVQANCDSFYTVLASSFDIAELDGAALYVNDGKVDSSWYSDNAKLYVETMKEWHDKGYIYNDIMSVTADRNDATDRELNFTGGDYFMFSDQAGHYGDFFTYDLPDGWAVSGGYTPVMNEGDITHFDSPDMEHALIVLSTNCEDVETAARFMDWFYTDEGILTSNYGPAGESWYYTPEGEVVFTELVWDDPDYAASTAIGFYQTTGRFVSVYEPWLNSLFAGSTVPIETQALWATDGDDAMTLPTDYLHLTTEESDIVNEKLSDLQTYAEETIASMILGQTDIDAEWDNLVATLQKLGLDDIIEQYDAAYQRYLVR